MLTARPLDELAATPISTLVECMIELTCINRAPIGLNPELISRIVAAPDTLIRLTTGQQLLVLESADEMVQKVIDVVV
jgi:uncharacterized protein YlzI (FlbEa/FlbD family)